MTIRSARKVWLSGLAAVGFGFGCGGVAPTAGNAELGIASFEVHESANRLSIVGRDAAAQTVASVDVVRGAFVMSDAFAEDRVGAARAVSGRQIDLAYRDVTLRHESQGFDPLELPLPPKQEFDTMYAFVVDPHVKPALASWGVAFQPRVVAFAAGDEVAYTNTQYACGGTCSGSPCGNTSLGAGQNCTQYGGASTNTCNSNGAYSDGCATTGDYDNATYPDLTYLVQCCPNVGPAEKACRPSSGASTPCGTGGGVGCAVCWNLTYSYDNCSAFTTSSGSCTYTNNIGITYTMSDGSHCTTGADCE